MLLRRIVVGILSAGLMVVAGMVSGQDYPNKTIRVIASALGGGGDFTARLIAPPLAVRLGQPVIVENRPSGVIPGETVANASPDGHTLLLIGSSFHVGPLMQKTPYDPVRDFSPITLIASEPSVLVVHPSLPTKSVKELIALAKARPGELNYSSGNSGSSSHLAGELFKSLAGVNIARIPYSGGSGALTTALMGGEVQLTVGGAAAVAPHIKSSRLRALAVTSAGPSTLLPGLPTVVATVPGYVLISINAMFAPAKTPATIINRLNQEMVRVISQADVKEKLFNTVQEIVGSSPDELAAFIKSDMATMGKVIKDARIRAE